jgi:hypothetical protein
MRVHPTGRRSATARRMLTRLCVVVVGALAATGAVAASSHAAPQFQEWQFDNGVFNLGRENAVFAQPSGDPLDSLLVDGNWDPVTSAFTVDRRVWLFPFQNATPPPPGVLEVEDMELNTDITTGSFNLATGQMSFAASLTAQLQIDGNECQVTINQANFSTDGTAPFAGARFPANTPTGTGAVVASLTNLPNGAGPGCGVINPMLRGAGGIWLSHGIAPPPILYLSVSPQTRRIRAGRTARFTVTAQNAGGAVINDVQVCASMSRFLGRFLNKRCQPLGDISVDESATARYRVGTFPGQRRQRRVTFTADADEVANQRTTAAVRFR